MELLNLNFNSYKEKLNEKPQILIVKTLKFKQIVRAVVRRKQQKSICSHSNLLFNGHASYLLDEAVASRR